MKMFLGASRRKEKLVLFLWQKLYGLTGLLFLSDVNFCNPSTFFQWPGVGATLDWGASWAGVFGKFSHGFSGQKKKNLLPLKGKGF